MKNKKALLVFSHQLTENQEKELSEKYEVKLKVYQTNYKICGQMF